MSESAPEPHDTRIDSAFIGRLAGDIFIFTGQQGAPQIPDEQGQLCPQCGLMAWRRSRWCWHCGFDFDRKRLRKLHPVKLLMLSAALNALLTAALLGAAYRWFH